jgi:hypothetical protein
MSRNASLPRHVLLLIALGALVLALAACGSSSSSNSSTSASGGASAEAQSAATGDIPDNQRFLRYRNGAAGYSIVYPEGWSRNGNGAQVSFRDKDNTVDVTVAKGPAPTVQSVESQLAQEASADPTLKPGKAEAVTAGPNKVIHVTFSKQGQKNPVTGQSPTLMVDRYVLGNHGRVATVDEGTPVGVDNVDAYRMIIESFRWE